MSSLLKIPYLTRIRLKLESSSTYSISLGLSISCIGPISKYSANKKNIVAYFGYRPSPIRWPSMTADTAFAGKHRSSKTADSAFVRPESTNQRRLGASGANDARTRRRWRRSNSGARCRGFVTAASIVVVRQKSMCESPVARVLKNTRGTW